jgi:hypothetical protein
MGSEPGSGPGRGAAGAPGDAGLFATAEELRRAAVVRDPWLAGHRVAAIGWATVELERAAEELTLAFRRAGRGEPDWAPAERETLLGATAWLGDVDGASVVLLEPDTEGRLAAALARFGEGVAAIYLAPGAAATAANASRLGASAGGPLGSGRVLLGRPAWGPHVLVLGR